ncbi:MAG: aminotransferase class I/II-fold pyridoxal phosphate-dependent enzyme [Clostridia bacterium]|nr:aminotransferase class I/II-fold pyridoxal phosphate-dependent enzyme [Clostridia bacterium]
MASLLSFLKSYASDFAPMHMPGGKRSFASPLPYDLDVTDLEATDDLYRPAGILKDLQDRIAACWGAERSFLLVNGSTAGVLAAVRATGTGPILAARNSHKSFYNASELCRRETVFVCPEQEEGIFGSVDPEAVRDALDNNPSIKTVFLTSPTYEGVVSDVRSIAEICREAGAVLIVDEAHGAHFGFSPLFPDSAVKCGADIVIQSLHKTLPALTQTAVLHCKEDFAEAVSRELPVFQTSSPSYILLASADECLRFLSSGDPFEPYERRLMALRDALGTLQTFRLLEGNRFFAYDPGKIVLRTRPPYTGSFCAGLLRSKFRIETEMSAPSYFLAMTSACDTDALYARFLNAVRKTDEELALRPDLWESPEDVRPVPFVLPEKVMEPFEVRSYNVNICSLFTCPGRVSADYVWAYPPGIPLLVPGERIPPEFPETAEAYRNAGIPLRTSFRADGIAVLE